MARRRARRSTRHWESEHGHAVGSARYGVLSRPSPAEEPERPPDDPAWSDEQRLRAKYHWLREQRWRQRANDPAPSWEFV